MKKCKIFGVALAAGMIVSATAFADGMTKKTTTTTTTTTAQDQSIAPADAEVTRKIRQQVMNQNISTEAKNVTIVTNSGKTVLTGQVNTAEEKATIVRVARGVSANVDDQLNVKK